MAKGLALHGIDMLKAGHFEDWLSQAGFSGVRKETFKGPTSPWPQDRMGKRLGLYSQGNLLAGLRGFASQVFRGLGMQPDEIEQFIAATERELRNDGIRSYIPTYVVYGQKPFIKEENIKEESLEQENMKVGTGGVGFDEGYSEHSD